LSPQLFANNLQTELVNDSGKNGVQSIDIAQVFSATARGIDYPLLADNHEQLLGLLRRDLISLEELNQRAENRTNVLHLAINLASAVAVGDRILNPHCKALRRGLTADSTAFIDPNYSSHVRFAQSDVGHPGPSEILEKNLFKGWWK
jgi:hypothetical protein